MTSLWFILIFQITILPDVKPPIIRATMHEKCIVTVGAVGQEPGQKWTFGGGNVWIEKKNLKDDSNILSLDYMFGNSGRKDALLRWQLINGQYYCVIYSAAGGIAASSFRHGYMNVVSLASIEAANANRKDARFYPDMHMKYQKLIESGPHLNPVGKAVGWGEDSLVNQNIYFDFWRRGEKQYEVYVTEPHKGNRLTRGDFHPESIKKHDYEKWETVGEWTFDWTGPFYVAVNGEDRFFVTDTGRVFVVPRAAKPGASLKEIAKGLHVESLIHDSDAKKFYAFTKDQYFEIADPIQPKPHTLMIRREPTADKALEIAAKCGRVIRGLPEPKGK